MDAHARPWPARGRAGRLGRPGIAVGIVVGLVLGTVGLWPPTEAAHVSTKMALFDAHIDHIVFLMQENHAFDNLFGTYCPTLSKVCHAVADGVPPGTCVPKYPANASQGCIAPYNLTARQLSPPDLPHLWGSTHLAVNGGAMNGFYYAEGNTSETFGHYNASTVPLYYDLAEEYGLADDFFSGSQSYSLANHWYEVAAMPPVAIQQGFPGQSPTVNTNYLNEANRTPNIASELLNSSVTWDYFDYTLPPTYQQAITPSAKLGAPAFDLWNPLAARAESYRANVTSHFLPRSAFLGDALNGTLPNISWIIPRSNDSDHPPMNLSEGQKWVASVVDAVSASPEWNSTVLFVSWDEYGGWYDHVAPPTLDAYGAGMRVPLLAIGPWVRPGAIDHSPMNFDSILHLMEKRFALPCIGNRDCSAALPLGMFNFSRSSPRPPIIFPANGTATYPMPRPSPTRLPPKVNYVGFESSPPPPDPGVLDWS